MAARLDDTTPLVADTARHVAHLEIDQLPIKRMAPGVADQLAGKAKAEVGKGEQRLGALTGHPEMATAGRKLEAEGKVEQIMGDVKAATADAAEQIKAAGERISEKLKGEPKQP